MYYRRNLWVHNLLLSKKSTYYCSTTWMVLQCSFCLSESCQRIANPHQSAVAECSESVTELGWFTRHGLYTQIEIKYPITDVHQTNITYIHNVPFTSTTSLPVCLVTSNVCSCLIYLQFSLHFKLHHSFDKLTKICLHYRFYTIYCYWKIIP